MAKKKKKSKKMRAYEPLWFMLPAAIAVILLIILIFWVFQGDEDAKQTGTGNQAAANLTQEQTESAQKAETAPEDSVQSQEAEVLETESPETESLSDTDEALQTQESLEEKDADKTQDISDNKQAEISKPTEGQEASEVVTGSMEDAEDPQTSTKPNQEASGGAAVDISSVSVPKGEGETQEATLGIDVSKYQGNIDWAAVAQAGVHFAIVRVGYRTTESGTIFEDPGARYNLQEATKNGLMVGAYFFSTAINEAEAIEEANWVADFISKYKITYPVAYNCEGFQAADSRQHHLTKEQRSALACAFLDTVAARGYTPMFYASRNEMEGSAQWNMSTLGSKYKVWVSQYPDKPFPETPASTYSGAHAMWQYTSKGKVAGIKGNVDVNVAYFGYSQEAQAKDPEPAVNVEANPEVGIDFTEVNEQVTAKNQTNLRTLPTTEGSQVVHVLKNGEVAQRTATGSNGWDRVIYNGQKLYAVHQYLTTNLAASGAADTGNAQASANTSQNQGTADVVEGLTFTAAAEAVTARDKVNLRDKPSTETGNIVGTLNFGEAVVRTGISGTSDTGWSRLEVNGQVVYASSRLLATSMDYKEQEKPSAQNPEAGFHFTAASGTVKAKDVTNLRTLPTTNAPSEIVAQLTGDATAARIAVDKDKGWTKLSYNGQTVYAVSSYLTVVE